MTQATRDPQRGLPLDDVRVVELGQLLAGPFCGQVLGDFGAEVIKVEDPKAGDPMRQWGREKPYGKSLWWPVVARNKKSVTCDLRTPEGQELVRQLVGQADVLLENFRPGTLERWNLAPEDLWKTNPGLIVTRVTGFGQTGPYAARAGFGSIGEAMGGIRYVTGSAEEPPSRAGISLGDSLAALHATLGTLVALHERKRSGRGQVVDAAIYESVLAMMESMLPEWQLTGYQRERTGPVLPNVAPSNVYPTRDGESVLIAANQDSVFARLAGVMGRPDLVTDQRFATHSARGESMADLNGIVAACRTASRRIQELCARFGVETYVSALDALLDRNYQAMKTLLATVFEDGETISFSDYICDDGVGFGPYELKLSLTRTGEKVLLDFTGSSPQSPGPINYYLNENLARMFFGIYMITVADPQILWNDGFYPLVDVYIPERSFWKPEFPAALNARNHGVGRIFDLFGGLLGQKNPDLLNAAGFSSSPHFMYSGHYADGERKGEWFQLYSIGFGGIPGRPIGDGPDGHSLWPSFVNIPCEYLESYYPLRIERWETVPDTGGAGLHRGGNGVDVAYHFLQPGTIAIHDDRWLTYPWGVNGGDPGARGRKWIDRADGTREVLPSKVHDVAVAKGDVLHFVTWGGGGWGDPLARDAELVALEVKRGLVTVEGTARYGVVLDGSTVDGPATETLRGRLRAERPGKPPVFNMGPPLAEILANCEAETGLPAPRVPA